MNYGFFYAIWIVFPKTDDANFLALMGGHIHLGTLSKFPNELEGQQERCLQTKPILSLLTVLYSLLEQKKTLREEEFDVIIF